jgi:carboxymethylenebutenolidase
MALKNEWINFGKDESCRGYLSRMERAEPGPALVVIQEAWGVDKHIQEVTERFAQAGYTALAPDLYSFAGKRAEFLNPTRIDAAKAFLDSLSAPGIWFNPASRDAALAVLPEDQKKQIVETMDGIFSGIAANRDQHLQIVIEAAARLRQNSETKVGSVGFCMGGGLSVLLACHDPKLAASVIFYGQGAPKELIPKINCNVLGFFGQTDKRLIDALPEFAQDMKEAGKRLEVHVYPEAGHAFFNDGRPSYNSKATRDSFARCLGFFNGALR